MNWVAVVLASHEELQLEKRYLLQRHPHFQMKSFLAAAVVTMAAAAAVTMAA